MTLDVHLPAKTFGLATLNANVGTQHALATWLVRGLDESWVVRGEDTTIPSASGKTARNRKRDYLTIELRGFAVGTGATNDLQLAAVRATLTALRAAFDPTVAPAALVIGLEDGDEATITCRPVNMFMLQYPDPVFRPFSIELVAVGGDWAISTP